MVLKDDDIKDLRQQFQTVITSVNPAIKIFNYDEAVCENRYYRLFSYKSYAMDTQIYNLICVTPIKDKVLQVCFNCEYNDYELIYMYRCGEKTALPLLLNKYKGAMVRIQRELIKTCPSIDKNDVFQELLLNFVKCLDLFDENKGVFFTYLYVCLKRTASHLLKEYFSPQERIHKTAISLDETTDLMDNVKLQDALINNDYLTNPSFCYEIK